jgi:hypothetical protein
LMADVTSAATTLDRTWQDAADKEQRSASKVRAKNDAKAAFKQVARRAALIVYAQAGLSSQQISDVGLTVRKTHDTPRPPPSTAPSVIITGVDGHAVSLLLRNGTSVRRAKPENATGASIFTFVGEEPSLNVADWTFYESTSETRCTVEFDQTLTPGTKVWVTAFWVNAKLQSSPAATPVGTQIQFGGIRLPKVEAAPAERRRAA